MKKIANKGFTLIELLVVVAIIAILALVVLLALNPVEMARRSRDSRRLSDMGTLRRAIDLSLADGKSLPGTVAIPYTNDTKDVGDLVANSLTNLVGMDVSKYLSTIPQDPKFTSTTATQVTDGTNCTTTPGQGSVGVGLMYYTFKSNGDTYELNSYMESGDNCQAVANEGGDDVGVYEVGTSLTLL